MPRKIAMVGTAESRVSAPYKDPEWEIWGVSARGSVPRASRWFELHRIDGTFEKPGEADLWRESVRGFMHDIPKLYMMFPEPDLAPGKVVTYPHDRIASRFGTYLMTSTFSWMMALAIDELAPIDPDGTRHFAEPGSTISVYGVDMEYGTEYRQQRQGFRSFMKIAEQLGIECHRVVSGGLIYEPVPYPLWQDDPMLCKLEKRNKEARETLIKRNEALDTTHKMMAFTNGALAEVKMQLEPPVVPKDEDTAPPKPYDPRERFEALEKQLYDLTSTSAQISKDIVAWQAIEGEQSYWRDYLMP